MLLVAPMQLAAQTVLPIMLTRDDGLCDRYEYSSEDGKEHYFYTSPVFHLESSVRRLRFTVPETTSGDSGGGYPCFALAEFYLYDGDGRQVTLTAGSFSTNAQEPKEGPMEYICDNNYGTYFHSLWSYRDESTGEHYIDVSLPTDMKDFAFGYVSRYGNVAPAMIFVDDADRIDEEKRKEEEERERIKNHHDTLLCSVTQTVKGRVWDIDLILQSSDDYIRYTALQMDLIPVSEELAGSGIAISFEQVRDRLPSHELTVGRSDWGTPRIVIYSLSLDSIRGTDGPFVHIRIASQKVIPPGRYVLNASGIRLSSADKLERQLGNIEIPLVSTEPVVNAEYVNANGDVVTLTLDYADDQNNTITLADDYQSLTVREDIPLKQISYKRNFTNTHWQSLYVPFEIPVTAELIETFDFAYINAARQYDYDDDGEIDELTIEIFKVKSGTLRANHPYLIRAKSTGVRTITVNEATLHATAANSVDCSTTSLLFTFKGSYETLGYNDLTGCRLLGGGLWKTPVTSTTMKPMRFYMKIEPRGSDQIIPAVSAATPVRMTVSGDDTGIASPLPSPEGKGTTSPLLQEGTEEAFDLQGRRVEHPERGIYILNNKKIIVR